MDADNLAIAYHKTETVIFKGTRISENINFFIKGTILHLTLHLTKITSIKQ